MPGLCALADARVARRAAEEAEAAQAKRERAAEAERQAQAAREAAQRAAAAERAALAAQRRVFRCSLDGAATASRAAAGAFTEGRLPVRATLQLTVDASSMMAGRIGPLSRACAGVRDAEARPTSHAPLTLLWMPQAARRLSAPHFPPRAVHGNPCPRQAASAARVSTRARAQDVAIALAGELAAALVSQQEDQYQLQGTVAGPLTLLDDPELSHWMRQLGMAAQVAATAALRAACREHEATRSDTCAPFKVRVEGPRVGAGVKRLGRGAGGDYGSEQRRARR